MCVSALPFSFFSVVVDVQSQPQHNNCAPHCTSFAKVVVRLFPEGTNTTPRKFSDDSSCM